MTWGWENNHKLIFRWINSLTKEQTSIFLLFLVNLVLPNSLICIFIVPVILLNLVSLCLFVICVRETDWKRERDICLHVLITDISDQRHAYPVCRDLFTAALRPERTSVLLHFPHRFQGPDSSRLCVLGVNHSAVLIVTDTFWIIH